MSESVMTYIAKYAHGPDDTPGELRLKAGTDAEARAELITFVKAGYRGDKSGSGTWASVELHDGRSYVCRNQFGKVVSKFGSSDWREEEA